MVHILLFNTTFKMNLANEESPELKKEVGFGQSIILVKIK